MIILRGVVALCVLCFTSCACKANEQITGASKELERNSADGLGGNNADHSRRLERLRSLRRFRMNSKQLTNADISVATVATNTEQTIANYGIVLGGDEMTRELPSSMEGSSNKQQLVKKDRVIGGVEIAEDRYPWIVTLFEKISHSSSPSAMRQVCGGSLIAPDIVLSAAHCVKVVNHVQIGRHDLRDRTDDDYEEFDIVDTVMHPDFDVETFDSDFVLFKLSSESKFPTVKLNRDSQRPHASSVMNVIGWGVNEVNETTKTSPLPFEAVVQYQKNTDCQGRYEGEEITENMLCAAGEGQDSCQGDSGGPLILKGADASQDVVVGIVSWGYQCAHDFYPGVYARVSKVADWIEETACQISRSSCALGLPSLSPIPAIYEAEDYTSQNGCTYRTSLSGRNYMDYGSKGSYVEWDNIFVSIAGQYRLTIHYAVKADGRKCRLFIEDAQEAFSVLPFASTGSWTSWREELAIVTLRQGLNTVRIESIGRGPNIDKMQIDFYTPNPTEAPTANPTMCDGGVFASVIFTDSYPGETSWALVKDGLTVASEDQYDRINTEYFVTQCIPEGSYIFTIRDASNDGLCCDYGRGAYRIEVDGNVVKVGGQFASSDQVEFTVGPTKAPTTQAPTTPSPTPAPTPNPTACEGGVFAWSILTDSYPQETTWTLTKEGIKYASGDGYNEVATNYSASQCIPEGVYTFTIQDSGNDGVCCRYGQGSYSIALDGTAMKIGGVFGRSEQVQFAVGPTPAPTPNPTMTPTPRPTTCEGGIFTWSMMTDNYPGETSWTLTDRDSIVFASGNGYEQVATRYSIVRCIPPGSYVFTILDTMNDGLCCYWGIGWYTIDLDGTILNTGGNFGSSEEIRFAVGPTEEPTQAPITPAPTPKPTDVPTTVRRPTSDPTSILHLTTSSHDSPSGGSEMKSITSVDVDAIGSPHRDPALFSNDEGGNATSYFKIPGDGD